MIGKTISHYKIIEKLGEGGMGVVYKAEDAKLQRTVALKFLPLDVAGDDEARARFINEARAASALNHPNICTIHAVEEGKQPFIAMEFVEGQTLAGKIESGAAKNLAKVQNLRKVLDYAIQIAKGLQAAHKKNIIHRDIKPANIMVTDDGQVKIMDFGLAKRQGQPALTQTGSTLGTVAYMSPEQAQGMEVDPRSDIFSFGAVLYELCSGNRPFDGDYEAAALYALVNVTPAPLEERVPETLRELVFKCLEKKAENRYQSTEELLDDLRQVQRKTGSHEFTDATSHRPQAANRPTFPAAIFLCVMILVVAGYFLFAPSQKEPAPDRKMLVVLPFENLGPPEDDYFSAGITDAITARLASIHGIGIISRQSAMQYKNSNKSIQEIGEDLGVGYVLEGTAQRERPSDPASRVRVIPQLIRVSDDTHLWADTYDQDMTEVFRVQSDIAERVAQALDITLLEPERRTMGKKPTENLEAYDYYLRGNDYSDRGTNKKDAEIAVRMYEKAVELDPNFAVAYAALSRARIWLSWEFELIDQVQKAKEALDRAQQITPDLAETHLALGYYYYYGSRDYDRAMEHFTIVQRRQPNDVEVTAAIAFIWRRQGKWEQAAVQLERAVELDPRNHNWLGNLGLTYLYMRRYAQAERCLDRAISLAPDLPIAYIHKYQLYLSWLGSIEKAEQVLDEAAGRIERRVLDIGLTAVGRAFIGADTLTYYLDKAETHYYRKQTELAAQYADSARSILETKIKAQPATPVWRQWLGWAYVYLGRHDEAIREARKAVELLPMSKDALNGCEMVESLALLYTVVGDHDAAIDQLEYLLTIPSIISVPRLKYQPEWEPLRQHPRFKQLLEKHGVESR